MTNADKIRAMSDKELAEFFSYNGGCPPFIPEVVCDKYSSHIKCWLDWLKQEAKEE